jgi:hypothetical protein
MHFLAFLALPFQMRQCRPTVGQAGMVPCHGIGDFAEHDERAMSPMPNST